MIEHLARGLTVMFSIASLCATLAVAVVDAIAGRWHLVGLGLLIAVVASTCAAAAVKVGPLRPAAKDGRP